MGNGTAELHYTHLNSKDCLFFLFLASLQSIVHDLHCVLLIHRVSRLGEEGSKQTKLLFRTLPPSDSESLYPIWVPIP